VLGREEPDEAVEVGALVAARPRKAGRTTSRRPCAIRSSTAASVRTTPNVYPERPAACTMGYIDGGLITLDIADKAHPKMIARWDYHPPNPGFTHTVVPFSLATCWSSAMMHRVRRRRLAKTHLDRPQPNRGKPVSIATGPCRRSETFARRGGRYGAHNLWENCLKEGCWKSENIVLGTFFGGGLRAVDLENPYQPKEVGYLCRTSRRPERALPD